MNGDIIIVGRRIDEFFWGYGLDENGGYSRGEFHEHPQLVPGGGGGWENGLHEVHTKKCELRTDAALSVAETITATDDGGSPNNWTNYEYGAVLHKDSSGRVGAFRNRVHTNWEPTFVDVGAPPNDPNFVEGLVHNHPPDDPNSLLSRNFASYPSVDDMDRFNQLVAHGKMQSSASLFIIDPDGRTREFPPSTFASIKSMSEQQRRQGEGLPMPLISGGTCTEF